MKQVIVLREKHGDLILDASTEAKMQKAALSIVKARFGGPQSAYLEDLIEPTKPDIARDKINTILNKELHRAAESAWYNYDREMQRYLRAKDRNDDIRRCIAGKSGRLAIQILESRSSYEYEGFSIENVLDVYPE